MLVYRDDVNYAMMVVARRYAAFTVAELLRIIPHCLYNPSLTQHQKHQLLLEKQGILPVMTVLPRS
jgi:hypothetical protein